MMKIKQLISVCSLAILGILAAGLCGCQQEEEMTSDVPGIVLSVSDGEFSGELPHTRTSEISNRTTFTEGDKIGFYSVKNNMLVAENVCLTLTGGVWTPPAGVRLLSGAERYFVYYPYQSSIDSVTATATTADDFFADLVATWHPSSDQSTKEKYTAQDLMTGSGLPGSTLSNGALPLTVTLYHRMCLAVIALPTGVTDISFDGFNPYPFNGSYRYLVSTTNPVLKGWFTYKGNPREYNISAFIPTGCYKTYTVYLREKAKVGDYFYSDETNSTEFNPDKFCIGVVFSVNSDGRSGKIVSLDEPVANWNGGTNEAGKLLWGLSGNIMGTSDDWDGATNMATVKAWVAANGKTLADLPAFKWCDDKGTGWYLPAWRELYALSNASATVNAALGSRYTPLYVVDAVSPVYWSSTEMDNLSGATAIWAINFFYKNQPTARKNVAVRTRAVRAF
jgi:hypothetical protein